MDKTRATIIMQQKSQYNITGKQSGAPIWQEQRAERQHWNYSLNHSDDDAANNCLLLFTEKLFSIF